MPVFKCIFYLADKAEKNTPENRNIRTKETNWKNGGMSKGEDRASACVHSHSIEIVILSIYIYSDLVNLHAHCLLLCTENDCA